jgi:hypothetical protein
MRDLTAGNLRKKAARRDVAEVTQKEGVELSARAMNYRYTPMKRAQLLRLSEALSEQAGRRVSYMKTLDIALDALEEKVEKQAKKQAKKLEAQEGAAVS